MTEYSYTYKRDRELSDKEIQQMGEAKAENEQKQPHILDLEDFAFSLLNQLSDEYNIHDDGSIIRAIWEANTPEQMNPIITQLQTTLLMAMKTAAGF